MDMTNCVGWDTYIPQTLTTTGDEDNVEQYGPYEDVKFLVERYEKAGINLREYKENHEYNNLDLDEYDPDDENGGTDTVPIYKNDMVDAERAMNAREAYKMELARKKSAEAEKQKSPEAEKQAPEKTTEA